MGSPHAFVDGRTAGTHLLMLPRKRSFEPVGDRPAFAISCFFIEPGRRRQGSPRR